MKRWLYLIGIIFLVAVALGEGWYAVAGSPALTHDSSVYLNVAENLSASGRLVLDMTPATSTQTSRWLCSFMPAYPVALSGLLLLGVPAGSVLSVMTLIGLALYGALLFALAWRLTGNLVVSLVAGLAALLLPAVFDAMTYALTETLYLPVSLAAFLLLDYYFERRKKRTLVALAVMLALGTLLRLVGGLLMVAIGAVIILRSLSQRNVRQAVGEGIAMGLSQAPAALMLVANYLQTGRFYCATNSAGWFVDRTNPALLAKVLLQQFKPDINLGLGLKGMAAALPTLAWVAIALVILALGLIYLWRQRGNIHTAWRLSLNPTNLAMLVYIVLYLGFFFVQANAWAQWDFPRYFVPTLPILILLVARLFYNLYRSLPALWVKALFWLFAAMVVLSSIQGVQKVLAPAHDQTRGIEAPEIRDHPALAYLRQTVQPNDLLFSTLEPTLWYYLDRPVKRMELIHTMSCEQIATPTDGGRSIFAVFPAPNYDGDPVDPANIAWFEAWIAPCGQVQEMKVFNNAAVYVVQPTTK